MDWKVEVGGRLQGLEYEVTPVSEQASPGMLLWLGFVSSRAMPGLARRDNPMPTIRSVFPLAFGVPAPHFRAFA